MQTRPDAQGMRHAAAQFRSKADRVSAVIARLEGQVGSMTFTGPAAAEFHWAMNAELLRCREIAGILGRATEVLFDAAAQVEADPVSFYSQGSGA